MRLARSFGTFGMPAVNYSGGAFPTRRAMLNPSAAIKRSIKIATGSKELTYFRRTDLKSLKSTHWLRQTL